MLPAAEVRKLRIIMLKATHWPFVAMIYGYEAACTWMEDHRRSGSSMQTGVFVRNSPLRPFARRALARSRTLLLDEQSQARAATTSAVATALQGEGAAASETSHAAAMATIVGDLQRQVEALTRLVTAQQKA